jgi:hypothetical protein
MKRSFNKIHRSFDDDDDDSDTFVSRRRLKRQKNVRTKHYKDNHLLNMLSTLTPEYQYARLLAESMDDLKSLPQYLKWVDQYPREVLEEIRRKVLSKRDIGNKGGYFTIVLRHHEFNQRNRSRD